jgi:hypothetical protein
MRGATRRELVAAISGRYQTAARGEKQKILDEFVAVTSYHRKHAVRILGAGSAGDEQTAPVRRPCRYDEAVREALVLWEASDRICGKRLKPLIPILVGSMERHGHLRLDAPVRERLLTASAATIDRLLTVVRAEARGGARRRPRRSIRRTVPVRTFADWNDPLPGYLEGDLVAHSGESAAGSFVQTLVLTDIASGWTECVALIVREQTLIVEALLKVRAALPFPLRGLDTDNDSVFMNDTLIGYCRNYDIELTRSRAYHKNDQAWVEQKNGAVVRRLVGYQRLEGVAAVQVLSRLYAASRLFVNFFQPSFKLASKERNGARVTKRYHPPATPYQRLLVSEAVPEEIKTKLRGMFAVLDPLRLLDEIRAAQEMVAQVAAGRANTTAPRDRDAELDLFLKRLATAWQEGEVRPTHRQMPRPKRYWRTRKDPFAAVWPTVRGWLEMEPERNPKELFQRLQLQNIGTFPDSQLRTLQRRVKAWRSDMARHLVYAESTFTISPPHEHELSRTEQKESGSQRLACNTDGKQGRPDASVNGGASPDDN